MLLRGRTTLPLSLSLTPPCLTPCPPPRLLHSLPLLPLHRPLCGPLCSSPRRPAVTLPAAAPPVAAPPAGHRGRRRARQRARRQAHAPRHLPLLRLELRGRGRGRGRERERSYCAASPPAGEGESAAGRVPASQLGDSKAEARAAEGRGDCEDRGVGKGGGGKEGCEGVRVMRARWRR